MNELQNYDLIAVFLFNGKRQYLIKAPGGASTLSEDDWKRLKRQNHNNKKNLKRKSFCTTMKK